MASPQQRSRLSVAEYLAGEVYAMSGASARHNAICGSLFVALHGHLAGGPCRVFMGEFKVKLRVLDDEYFYYPDIMVACRPERPAAEGVLALPHLDFRLPVAAIYAGTDGP